MVESSLDNVRLPRSLRLYVIAKRCASLRILRHGQDVTAQLDAARMLAAPAPPEAAQLAKARAAGAGRIRKRAAVTRVFRPLHEK